MIKPCSVCGKDFYVKDSHAHKRNSCSTACMAASYKVRMLGQANPNFRGIAPALCLVCGGEASPKRKYCSSACYGISQRKPEGEKAPRPSRATGKRKKALPPRPKFRLVLQPRDPSMPRPSNRVCGYCAAGYFSHNKSRKFCSYRCFVESGGPIRAGMEASKMTRKYGAKKDANHNEVAEVFSRLGVPFYDLSSHGRGLPDGLAWAGEQWRLVEIKNPKTGYGRRGLNPIQLKWLSQGRGGPIFVISSVEEAIKFAEGKFDEVQKEWPQVPERAA